MSELVTKKLRPGDIYTHCYSGLRDELDETGHVNPAMFEARKRGVIFDVGHGGGSFAWRIAVPAMKQGFPPDSISTDLHIGSMNSGMKDMDNVMSKFLVMGQSMKDVVAESTWNPAREIHHEELGNLSPGAIADVAVLRVARGDFGYTDMYGARLKGNQKIVCELTLKDGKVVYDLNGITRPDWTTLPKGYKQAGDAGGTRSTRRRSRFNRYLLSALWRARPRPPSRRSFVEVCGADALVRAGPPGPAFARKPKADEGVGRGPGGPPHLAPNVAGLRLRGLDRRGRCAALPHRSSIC